MNRRLLLNWLGFVLVACTVSCQSTPQSETVTYHHQPKYKIDGNFDDWQSYKTAQTTEGYPWDEIVITPPYEGIIINEFYYDNDDAYLYLFFKCKPTVQELYDKTHSTGALGYLYIDSDMNTNTGCTDVDTEGTSPKDGMISGNATIPGADIQIYLPIGFYINETTSGCYVSYEIKRWEPAAKSFSKTVRIEDSKTSPSLIAHGKDGVELAIPLTDLHLKKASQFSCAFWGDIVGRENVKRTAIQLK